MTILVVDDSLDDLELVRGLLARTGLRVTSATSMTAAVALTDGARIDVVVSRASLIERGAADSLVKDELTATGLSRAILAALERFRLHDENEALRAAAYELAEREREARQATERALAVEQRARERVSMLFDLAADLTTAATQDRVVEVVIERVRRALGAEAVSLYTCNGVDLRLRGAVGFADAALDPWRIIPLSAPTPISDAARVGMTSTFLMTQDIVDRYGIVVTPGRTWFAVPLHGGSTVTGVLGLKYVPESLPDAASVEMLGVVAVLVGQTLHRAQLLDEARASADRESRMLAVLGHDLRTPLDVVTLAPDLLRQGRPLEAVLGRVERATATMRDLIADILARSAARHAPLQDPDNLTDFTAEVSAQIDQLRAGNPARQIDLEVTNRVPLQVDRVRLAQIVSNLVRNALTHGARDGAVLVTASSHPDGARLEVANRGPEIPPELRGRLFQPFERGKASTGSGLGLFIVQETAAHLGGTVDVCSSPERTVFTVRLPPKPTPPAARGTP